MRLSPALTLSWFVAVAALANPPNDLSEIQKTFNGYKKALDKKDGKAAARLVDGATLDYYSELRKLALDGDRATLRKQPVIDQMMVLRLRLEVPLQQLEKMSEAEVFGLGVNRGWVGANAQQNAIGPVTVTGDTAKADAMVNGKKAPFSWEFRKEGGAWKLSLLQMVRVVSGQVMDKMLVQSGLEEDQFVEMLLTQTTGKKLPATLWEPLRSGK